MRPARAVWVVLAAAAMAAPLHGQQKARPPEFGVDVRLVSVPVFVTDRAGQSVAGLTADDFEIEDQGRKVPVAGFLAVDSGSASAELPAGTSPALA
ncbi:MAG TPA: hypothetical protein VFO85_03930, partial [Vicinamibacteria bacterium]|nr:hypothetical protein [Vicinamibacteria bacterium]